MTPRVDFRAAFRFLYRISFFQTPPQYGEQDAHTQDLAAWWGGKLYVDAPLSDENDSLAYILSPVTISAHMRADLELGQIITRTHQLMLLLVPFRAISPLAPF
jgi:hypothetical protein